MTAAGVDTTKCQAHAIRGEALFTLWALGWPAPELLPLSRHCSVAQLERIYIRRAPDRFYNIKIDRARYRLVEALRL
jgi:hypothetical protein